MTNLLEQAINCDDGDRADSPSGRLAHTQVQSDWSHPLPQRIVISTVATLTTLADVRVLIEQLPEDRRANPTWCHVAAQLEQAAVGVDVIDLGIALRLALMMEGLQHQAK